MTIRAHLATYLFSFEVYLKNLEWYSNMEIGETHAKITQDNEKTGCRSTYFSVVLRRIYEIILVIFVSLFVEYSYISIRRATNTIIYI